MTIVAFYGCDWELADPGPLFFGGRPPRDMTRAVQDAAPIESWDLVAEWGEMSDGLLFSIINDVAVSRDSILAVADRHTCSVIFVAIAADSTWSIGRCGDGPGEFDHISAIEFDGPILWAYDRTQRKLAALNSHAGTVEREVPLDRLLPAARISGVRSIVPMGDGRLVLGIKHLPPGARSSDHLALTVDIDSERLVDQHVVDPQITFDTPFAWAPSVHLCGSSELWAVTNEWTAQVRLYADDRLRADVLFPAEWWMPVDQRGNGTFIPTWPEPGLACSGQIVAVGHKKWWLIGSRLELLNSRLVVMNWDGEPLLVDEVESPADGSPHAFTVSAILGDLLFVETSTYYDYPVVRAYRLPLPLGELQ